MFLFVSVCHSVRPQGGLPMWRLPGLVHSCLYFLTDYHCITPRTKQKLLKFLQGDLDLGPSPSPEHVHLTRQEPPSPDLLESGRLTFDLKVFLLSIKWGTNIYLLFCSQKSSAIKHISHFLNYSSQQIKYFFLWLRAIRSIFTKWIKIKVSHIDI